VPIRDAFQKIDIRANLLASFASLEDVANVKCDACGAIVKEPPTKPPVHFYVPYNPREDRRQNIFLVLAIASLLVAITGVAVPLISKQQSPESPRRLIIPNLQILAKDRIEPTKKIAGQPRAKLTSKTVGLPENPPSQKRDQARNPRP
jgi:hypothetical protein